ncbi:MAG: Gldg family protein [Pseudomonadales bacterium]|nr:Gldg family protein [Pseudomonadales bacterium]
MQPDRNSFKLVRRIATKEISLFFASPIAYLFLAAFAGVTLFTFFWGEAFFARNIADVRPLFEWMPVLLIFLSSTLTMRLWSEERRTGTLEHILTQPVSLLHFVLGKFLGCLFLLGIALLVTLPLPITVSLLGELDWGPVWAGYLATFLLGASYLSIGLFISAKSDNQIVSLISAVALCGLFYLLGTDLITDFFGNTVGEWLRLLGTGSRFDAITRGVIDFRDLYYYLSIIGVFLALNTFVLEQERWATSGNASHHRQWRSLTLLLLANVLGANLWLGQINALRVDATAGNQYSISQATRNYLSRLQEPLLLRGYFSSKTHPLLAPLVPQLRDLLQEYAIAGNDKVRVEFVDPVEEPGLAEEAGQKYGIQPVPFQVADRYQSAIVSSYFNILVEYGDEHQVLGFDDLIEVKAAVNDDLDVQLRNPEYDLTSAVKTVLNHYQAGGNLFETIKGQVTFNAYVSADALLPETLKDYRASIEKVIARFRETANGRFESHFIDPEADNGAIAKQIEADYGFRPMSSSILSNDRFYFYLTLEHEGQLVQLPLDDITEAGFERNLEAGIKRFVTGFTKTLALVSGGAAPASPYGNPGAARFNQLREFLGTEHNVVDEDLDDGSVSGAADLLLLLAPENLSEKALFAVDQFLMQGGTVLMATSPYKSSLTRNSLSLQPVTSGLEDWLAHNGLTLDKQLVMDPQNAAFPVPVTRNIGGFNLQEMQMLDYPYFIDVRGQGLDGEHMVTADLPQATLAWSSPIIVDQAKNAQRTLTRLLQSSEQSWLSSTLDVMPVMTDAGSSGYSPQGQLGSQLLGVISSGQFTSYFAGKESPLLARQAEAESGSAAPSDESQQTPAEENPAAESAAADASAISGVIEKSPESARIILISSNDFLNDQILQFLGTATGSNYVNTLQLMANNVDWSLEDAGLLSIRSRGHFNRTLPPMEKDTQMFWEYLNYAMAGMALGLTALVQRRRKHIRLSAYSRLFSTQGGTHS